MRTAFHALHAGPEPLLLPNAWDFASAAVLAEAGFPALGTTSLGVAAAHGLPDAEGVAGPATLDLVRRLRRLPCMVSVDMESGFDPHPERVADLAEQFAAAGAVGVNLEDGRAGGILAAPADQCAVIREVRRRLPDLYINARVDTYWLRGTGEPSLPDTLARAADYLGAGADGVYVPALIDPAGITAVVELGAPVNLVYLPGGPTVAQMAELGVRRISCGSLLFRAALRATVSTARAAFAGEPLPGDIPGYAEVDRLSR